MSDLEEIGILSEWTNSMKCVFNVSVRQEAKSHYTTIIERKQYVLMIFYGHHSIALRVLHNPTSMSDTFSSLLITQLMSLAWKMYKGSRKKILILVFENFNSAL